MMRLDATPIEAQAALRQDELLVYEAMSYEARSVDAVIEQTGLSAAQVSATLLSLELRGRIRQLPGQQYIRL
jgi:DNA processing protein